MFYFRQALRHIRARPGRALLTTLSIVLAVAAVVAVSLTTRTTRRAFDDIFRSIAGQADLEVSAGLGTTMDASLLPTVSSAAGVKVASPLIQRYTVMYAGEKRVQLIALGVDPQVDRAVHDYRIVAGQPLDDAKGILLDDAFAKSLDIKLHDQVELQTRRGFVRTQVVGLYSSQQSATAGQGAVMLMPLRAAQYVFMAPNRFDSIQLVLQPDADEAIVKRELAEVLPQGVTVQKPATRSPIAEQTSLSTEIGLNMARTFALVVALFIIANTFAINVTQQRHSLGIMRAIGATRRQIGAFSLSEALMLGVVGTSLGCAAGLPIAHILNQAMGALYSTTLPPLQLHWEPLLCAALLGIGVSLAGAIVPAYKAGSLSPLEAMRETTTAESRRMLNALAGFGVVLILSSAALIYFTLAGSTLAHCSDLGGDCFARWPSPYDPNRARATVKICRSRVCTVDAGGIVAGSAADP